MPRASCSAATSMHRSWALLALALALLLGAASLPAPAPAAVSNCTLLANNSSKRAKRPANVRLLWGSEPAHAASALLSALLRYVLMYDGVYLPLNKSQHLTTKLATNVPFNIAGRYTEYIISLSTAWEQEAVTWKPRQGMHAGLAGPRLQEFGASPVTARRRLHAHLSPHASQLHAHCSGHERWSFYTDRRVLADCDFLDASAR